MRAWVRSCSDRATPAQVFRRLAARARAAGRPAPAALVGEWFGRGAVLAPTVTLRPSASAAAAFAVPDRMPARADIETDTDTVPAGMVAGGWIGYLGYGLTDPGRRERRLPAAMWGWTDHVLRQDETGRWWFETLLPHGSPTPLALAAELADLIEAAADDPVGRPAAGAGIRPGSWPDADRYAAVVRACLAAIADGEIYQANICVRVELPPVADPAELFAAGVEAFAPPRAAYLAGPWGAAVSLSPELFLARHGRSIRSSPIKGTRPRRGSPAEDVRWSAALRGSAKDVAENIMITDMVRNDLGRVALAGSVRVPELLAVHPAPGVWHLVSTVTAELSPGVTDSVLLAATFPPASVTGTPKLRALELLAGWEDEPREIYCGAIGMASPLAGLELSVAIRTIEMAADGTAWLGVGGGITTDSRPEAEWQECLDKATPLLGLLADSYVLKPPHDVA